MQHSSAMPPYGSNRISLEDTQSPLRRLLKRNIRSLIGVVYILVAGGVGVALGTWSVTDPSLSHATDAPVANALGSSGAIIADLLMQAFGLGALVLLFPAFIVGARLFWKGFTGLTRRRVLSWLLAILFGAGLIALIPPNEQWPLPTGLGGFIGDWVVSIPTVFTDSLHKNMQNILLIGMFGGPAALLLLHSCGWLGKLENPYALDGEYGADSGYLAGEEEDEDEDSRLSATMGALTHWRLMAGAYLARVFARKPAEPQYANIDEFADEPLEYAAASETASERKTRIYLPEEPEYEDDYQQVGGENDAAGMGELSHDSPRVVAAQNDVNPGLLGRFKQNVEKRFAKPKKDDPYELHEMAQELPLDVAALDDGRGYERTVQADDDHAYRDDAARNDGLIEQEALDYGQNDFGVEIEGPSVTPSFVRDHSERADSLGALDARDPEATFAQNSDENLAQGDDSSEQIKAIVDHHVPTAELPYTVTNEIAENEEPHDTENLSDEVEMPKFIREAIAVMEAEKAQKQVEPSTVTAPKLKIVETVKEHVAPDESVSAAQKYDEENLTQLIPQASVDLPADELLQEADEADNEPNYEMAARDAMAPVIAQDTDLAATELMDVPLGDEALTLEDTNTEVAPQLDYNSYLEEQNAYDEDEVEEIEAAFDHDSQEAFAELEGNALEEQPEEEWEHEAQRPEDAAGEDEALDFAPERMVNQINEEPPRKSRSGFNLLGLFSRKMPEAAPANDLELQKQQLARPSLGAATKAMPLRPANDVHNSNKPQGVSQSEAAVNTHLQATPKVPAGSKVPETATQAGGGVGTRAPVESRAENQPAANGQPRRNFAVISSEYEYPPIGMLARPTDTGRFRLTSDALEQNARNLEGVLEDFGVRGEIIAVRPGPVVTLYELEPAPGIKSSRVIGLADDIARSMSAISARVAVIPGKNAIGIELPNAKRQTVFLRELLESNDFKQSKGKLALSLGKTINGEPVIADLARMPHLLVAGTTGSGKSVSVNTMILSLLFRLSPDQCKLIMIDPKMLELSIYDGIPHLLTPVVTDPNKAVVALKWTVREMEDRYKKMSKMGVRNIDGFNTRVEQAKTKGERFTRTVQTGFDRHTGEPIFEEEELPLEKMPYIVVVVDEMADLMMVAGKDIEGAIQRLAQMARAAGIHIIMATQRPSVDVITGTIKANFPTRISFQVTSKIDSRTILGEMGAEQLLGMGDMLYMAGGGKTKRVHGPFVSDDEVEAVVQHLKAQGTPQYLAEVTEGGDEGEGGYDALSKGSGNASNDLFDQAVAIVARDRKASTSYIQRRLSIGYNRAATLIERMEEEGIIGPANHAGKREILLPDHEGSI